jgi:hypothetical protein
MSFKLQYIVVIFLMLAMSIIFERSPEAALLGFGAFIIGYLVKRNR